MESPIVGPSFATACGRVGSVRPPVNRCAMCDPVALCRTARRTAQDWVACSSRQDLRKRRRCRAVGSAPFGTPRVMDAARCGDASLACEDECWRHDCAVPGLPVCDVSDAISRLPDVPGRRHTRGAVDAYGPCSGMSTIFSGVRPCMPPCSTRGEATRAGAEMERQDPREHPVPLRGARRSPW
ncbi:hypothetical protein BV20DRAFT_288710 [Pilatotrama ljubarskyi]|nr:hypothetical protein BV20DRAFT_288710 [Pilatotrama ljubarskyi]